MKKTLKEIVVGLEGNRLCNCDLDKWEPEKETGHTLECRIYLLAVEEFRKQKKF